MSSFYGMLKFKDGKQKAFCDYLIEFCKWIFFLFVGRSSPVVEYCTVSSRRVSEGHPLPFSGLFHAQFYFYLFIPVTYK